jgi:hypothetical protein
MDKEARKEGVFFSWSRVTEIWNIICNVWTPELKKDSHEKLFGSTRNPHGPHVEVHALLRFSEKRAGHNVYHDLTKYISYLKTEN